MLKLRHIAFAAASLLGCVQTASLGSPIGKVYRCTLIDNDSRSVDDECLQDAKARVQSWLQACAAGHVNATSSWVCDADCRWEEPDLCWFSDLTAAGE